MPVQLSNDTLVETHVHTSQLNAAGKFSNGGLTSPPAFLGQ